MKSPVPVVISNMRTAVSSGSTDTTWSGASPLIAMPSMSRLRSNGGVDRQEEAKDLPKSAQQPDVGQSVRISCSLEAEREAEPPETRSGRVDDESIRVGDTQRPAEAAFGIKDAGKEAL